MEVYMVWVQEILLLSNIAVAPFTYLSLFHVTE